MEVELSHLWNGEAAPEGVGGPVRLELRGGRLELAWDLRLAAAPRVPSGPAGYTERLWEWDVLELFLAGAEPQRYVELEFGPGGHWIALGFAGVRQRVAELRELEPELTGVPAGGRWRGRAAWPAAAVEAHADGAPWRGLIAAVLERGAPGERLHLTWPALPGRRPDFHQPWAWAALDLGEHRPG